MRARPLSRRRDFQPADVGARNREVPSQVRGLPGEVARQSTGDEEPVGADLLGIEDLRRIAVLRCRPLVPGANLVRPVVDLALVEHGRVVTEQSDDPLAVPVWIELEVASDDVGQAFPHRNAQSRSVTTEWTAGIARTEDVGWPPQSRVRRGLRSGTHLAGRRDQNALDSSTSAVAVYGHRSAGLVRLARRELIRGLEDRDWPDRQQQRAQRGPPEQQRAEQGCPRPLAARQGLQEGPAAEGEYRPAGPAGGSGRRRRPDRGK